MRQRRVMSIWQLDIVLYIIIALVDIKTSYYLSETKFETKLEVEKRK